MSVEGRHAVNGIHAAVWLARAEGKTLSAMIQDALRRIVEEKDQRVLSPPILDELLGILARKFSRDSEELAHVAVFLSELALFVKPRRRPRVVTDDPDNRIIECAVTGRAGAIVTGDRALVRLREHRGVRIISLREYLTDALGANASK